VDDPEDLNQLIRELNSEPGGPAAPTGADGGDAPPVGPPDGRLERWLERLLRLGGSDLLLVGDAPPAVRRGGRIELLEEDPLAGAEIERLVLPAIAESARRAWRSGLAADSSIRAFGRRFRANLHRERGRAAAAIRALPAEAPRLAALGLPETAARLARLPRGLVLVAGPTGSGKTTTLAALVEEINRTEARHIVTIEDPIEFEHTHGMSVVEQVEIGIDSPSFPAALRAALRQAPDVLVIGEMRDPETMAIALSAAETGHLVFSTVHTADAAGAVSRLADSFPPERQNTIRQEIAMSLAAVLSQHLLPRADGPGRVVAAELFFVTYGARQHIRKNALQHLHQEITLSRKSGSVTMEESLARLVQSGRCALEDARTVAHHPEEFDSLRAR
jgi:twitching motility protein PilT